MPQIRRGGAERAAYWRKLIAAWPQSGQTQAAFCQGQGVAYWSFCRWKRKLALEGGEAEHRSPRGKRSPRSNEGTHPTKTGSFVEVQMAGMAASPAYEVVLARGRVLRIFGAFDSESVSRLISAVEEAR